VFTGLGAAVNALPGGEIVSAMDRVLGFPDVSKNLHAVKLSPEYRAVRDHVQQDEV
jgi:hypothetical protein